MKKTKEVEPDTDQLWNTILETLPAQVVLLDCDGEILRGNRAWREFVQSRLGSDQIAEGGGYLALWGEVFDPGDTCRRALEAGLQEVLEGASSQYELTCAVAELRVHVAATGDSEQIGAVVTHWGLASTEVASAQKSASELDYRDMVEMSRDLVWQTDGEGRFTYMNGACRRILGYQRKEMVGRLFTDFATPEQLPVDQAVLQHLSQNPEESACEFERRVFRRDGTVAILGSKVTLHRDAAGNVTGTSGTCTDLTDRIETEEALRMQAQMLDGLGQAVITTDLEGKIIYANPFAEELYDWAPSEMVGRNLLKLIVPEISLPQAREALECLADGSQWGGEILLRRGNGTLFPALVTGSPWFDQDGKPAGIVGMARDITERKRLEAEREELLRSRSMLLESTSEGIFGVDREGVITFINPAAANMLGYEAHEVIGKKSHDLIHHHHRDGRIYPAEDCPVYEALRSQVGRRVSNEVFWRKDGTFFPVEYASNPIREEDGFSGAVVTFLDISERLEDQKKLEESEARLRELAETIRDVVYSRDARTGEMLYISPAYEEIWGRSCESLYRNPRSYLEAIHPEERVANETAHLSRVAGAIIEREYRIIRPDGSMRWIHDRSYPVVGEAGAVERVVGTACDITEQREAAARVREQAALLEKAKDAIVVWDLHHKITYWNPGAERMLGWTAADVIGEPASKFFTEPSVFDAAMEALLEQGEWSGELRQLSQKGAEVIIEARWTLVRGENDASGSILAINSDVTEQKNLEKQYLRAQRLESIGVLAGGIAHDLNNVLAPIIMGVDFLKLGKAAGGREAVIDTIAASAHRGADMVKQLLTFARGMGGRRIEVNPVYLIKDVVRIVSDTFPKNIQIKLGVRPPLPRLLGDPTQLHQVLLNLCVNARDAMPAGGFLTIRAEDIVLDEKTAADFLEARPGRHVMIEVADTGTGIAPDILEQIFDPFFTTKEVGKGTGLGLSTSLAIVKSHGGFISIDSEVDAGSRFRFYLPAGKTQTQPSVDEKSKSNIGRGAGELILIVDDEGPVRNVLKCLLESRGFRAILATDGCEGIRLFEEHQEEIAVVIMDMTMPVMDGKTAMRRLIELDPDVRVIAVSGIPSNESQANALGPAVVAFVAKPFTADVITDAVQRALAER